MYAVFLHSSGFYTGLADSLSRKRVLTFHVDSGITAAQTETITLPKPSRFKRTGSAVLRPRPRPTDDLQQL